jgi:hypothetical protein
MYLKMSESFGMKKEASSAMIIEQLMVLSAIQRVINVDGGIQQQNFGIGILIRNFCFVLLVLLKNST